MYSPRLSKNYSDFREKLNPVDIFFLKQLTSLVKSKDVLDIGCGNGTFLFEIENFMPRRIVGIDNSTTMVDLANEEARLRNSMASLKVMDAENLHFSDNTFDLIVSTFTIHHFIDLERFFHSVSSILRPNGLFMATFNTFDVTDADLIDKEALLDLRSGKHLVTVSNTIRPDKAYKDASRSAGLQEITYCDIPNPVPTISAVNDFTANKISKLNNIYAVFKKPKK
jgi:ubiquinone/menaquinone biosynthesis C-methylase UbiE